MSARTIAMHSQDRQRMKGTKRARIWTKWKETRERRDGGREREKKKENERQTEERRGKTTRQT